MEKKDTVDGRGCTWMMECANTNYRPQGFGQERRRACVSGASNNVTHRKPMLSSSDSICRDECLLPPLCV